MSGKPRDVEAEREALLAELAAGEPMTEERIGRVVAVAAADLDRVERLREPTPRRGRPDPDTAQQRFLDWFGRRYADLLIASGLRDVLRTPPASIRWRDDDSGVDVVVESASRGPITIGTLDALEIAREHGEAMEGYVRELAAANVPLRAGRPSDVAARIDAIVSVAADLPAGADTRDRVAAVLGRVRHVDGEPIDEPTSQYKADVAAAGGWQAIKRRAEELRAGK